MFVLFKHIRSAAEGDTQYSRRPKASQQWQVKTPDGCDDEEAAAQAGTSCGTRQSLGARDVEDKGFGGEQSRKKPNTQRHNNVPCHSAVALQRVWQRRGSGG